LYGADFSNANLEGANFSGANLAKSLLQGSHIEGANFSGANLRDALWTTTPAKPSAGTDMQKPLSSPFVSGFRFDLNPWNQSKAPVGSWKQELRRRPSTRDYQMGWTWAWPDLAQPKYQTVYAYPEAIFGRKPWDDPKNAPSTTNQLPIALKNLSLCELFYDVDLSVKRGVFNLAPEVWIVDKKDDYKSDNVTAELMFWMDYADDDAYLPAQHIESQIRIGGLQYDVFVQDMTSGAIKWKYVAFRVRKPSSRGILLGRLPLHEFIKYCVVKGHVNPAHYLASIEFGTEVLSGEGSLWINSLDIVVE